MKKIIITFLFISFVSCNNVDLSKPKYQPVSVITNQVSYGTTLEEFLEIAGDRAEKTSEYSYEIFYEVYQYDKDDNIIKTATFRFDVDRRTTTDEKKYSLDNISTKDY